MNPAQLLNHFDRLAEAPEAVPRMRRFILDLAVRGKLVEQDPSDEPASELLKRIQAEKARLAKNGSIRREQALAKIDEESLPFLLPARWTWVRLGEVIDLIGGQHLQPDEYSNDKESERPSPEGEGFKGNGMSYGLKSFAHPELNNLTQRAHSSSLFEKTHNHKTEFPRTTTSNVS